MVMFVIFGVLPNKKVQVLDTSDNTIEEVYPEELKVIESSGYEVRCSSYYDFVTDLWEFCRELGASMSLGRAMLPDSIKRLKYIQNKLDIPDIKLISESHTGGIKRAYTVGLVSVFAMFLCSKDMCCADVLAVVIGRDGKTELKMHALKELMGYASRDVVKWSSVKFSKKNERISLEVALDSGKDEHYKKFVYNFTETFEML